MRYVIFGRSGIEVSVICLGCWAAGGIGWGRVDDNEIIKAIEVGVNECGINFIDTADVYGYGHSERLVGEAVRRIGRSKVIIATKVGLRWDRKKTPDKIDPFRDVKTDLSPSYISEAVYESLRRLKTDYIDIYQAHWPDPKTPLDALVEAMERLCEKGDVRFWGVSNFSAESIEKIAMTMAPHFTSDQPPYNLIERGVEKDIIPVCRRYNIALMVYSPLAMGLLTGKYRELPKFEGFDWRNYSSFFSRDTFYRVRRAIEKCRKFAEKYGVVFGQIAISWVLRNVEVAICGFKNEEQVRQNAKATEVEIEENDAKEIESYFDFAQPN